MKKGFSLLELIFAIVVIGIISSFAIPKYMDTRNSALASTIQRDLVTTTTSVQSYYLVNRSITNISDAVSVNTNNWTIDSSNSKKMTFEDAGAICVTFEITDVNQISIKFEAENNGGVCEALNDMKIISQTIDLI